MLPKSGLFEFIITSLSVLISSDCVSFNSDELPVNVLEVVDEASSFIVPKKPLNLLKNAAAAAEKVQMQFNDSNARFDFDDVSISCRLIEGKYPNYDAVIPKDNPNRMTINRMDFLQAIRRVAIFANKTTHQVRLRIAGSELTVNAEDLDFANELIFSTKNFVRISWSS